MKPTKKMLGKPGAFTRERSNAVDAGPEEALLAAAAAPASAKVTPSELMERVAAVVATLTKMEQPPPLGVRAKGTENVPSLEAWKAARERALQRLKSLQSRLKGGQGADDEKRVDEPPVTAGEAALDPNRFARELDQVSRTLDLRRPPKEEG